MTWTKVFLVTAGVGAVAAMTFGILELKAESDYEKAVGQQQMDDIAAKGRNYALLTNIGIVVTAVGLVGAGIAGYPLVLRPSEKTKARSSRRQAALDVGVGLTSAARRAAALGVISDS